MQNTDLRHVENGDHEWLVELHNDPVVLRNLTHPTPITLDQHMRWWEGLRGDSKQRRLIFTVDNVPAGFAKFYDIDKVNKNCVLGADLHKDFRGKGLAKFMWARMLDLCFDEEGLGLHRASLTTAEYNDVARRVYLGLGFQQEGRLTQSLYRDGKYWDQVCMFMLKDDWKGLK